METSSISRRAFFAGAGTVLASLTVPLGAAPALADDAAATTAAASTPAEKIVIIGTNDVHGTLKNPKTALGYAALKDYADAQRTTHGDDRVTLVDSGDIMQGNLAVTLSDGAFLAQAVAACGYDVIAPGNHDFDHGIDKLTELVAAENVACTCCNLTDANGDHVLSPYHVVEYPLASGTVRVAFVGATTPSARSSSSTFKDADGGYLYDFANDDTGEKLVATVQSAVDDARGGGQADYVVLLAHLGQSWSAVNWRSDTVVAKTNGIDTVVDAHTHQLYVQTVQNKDGQEVPVVQAGCKFLAFSRLEIDPAARTATASVVATGVAAELVDSWDGEDAEVAALIADFDAQIDDQTSEQVGTSEVDLVALADDGSQAAWLGETNLGDLVTDAIMDAAGRAGVSCDVVLYNGFDLCADIPRGAVTRRQVLDALPFSRKIWALEVSGQHLLDVLEVGCALLPEPEARLMQVSDGLSYQVRTDVATPVQTSPANNAFVRIDGERRVTGAKLNGRDIDPAGRYTIAMNKSMLLSGAWSMPVPESTEGAVQVGVDNECLVSYMSDTLGGTIGEKYADTAGRLKIADSEAASSDAGAAGNSTASANIPFVAVGAAAAVAVAAGAAAARNAKHK